MRILVTPTFNKAIKKLHQPQKIALDQEVRKIAAQPDVGETKVGDLAGVKVHKFRLDKSLYLLAYRLLDEQTIKLLMLGTHENFYRDLKRIDG